MGLEKSPCPRVPAGMCGNGEIFLHHSCTVVSQQYGQCFGKLPSFIRSYLLFYVHIILIPSTVSPPWGNS